MPQFRDAGSISSHIALIAGGCGVVLHRGPIDVAGRWDPDKPTLGGAPHAAFTRFIRVALADIFA
jgi:hypothetical protein